MLFEEMSMKAKRTHMIQKVNFFSVILLYRPKSLNHMSTIAMPWYQVIIARESLKKGGPSRTITNKKDKKYKKPKKLAKHGSISAILDLTYLKSLYE